MIKGKKRTKPVIFYLTENERRAVDELTNRDNTSISELFRQLLKRSAKAEGIWPKEKELA